MNISRLSSLSLCIAGALVFLSSCAQYESYQNFDREAGVDQQTVRDVFAAREVDSQNGNKTATSIPEFSDYTSTKMDDMKPMPIVSVSVNETIPLRDVLYELARQANYDVELDSNIQGALIFSATNRPLDEVLTSLCEMAGLRYSINNNTVRIEIDRPFTRIYKIGYLNMTRQVSSSISSSAGGTGSASGATATTASSFSITGTTGTDFWADFEANLKDILEKGQQEVNMTSAVSAVVALPSAEQEQSDESDQPDSIDATAETSTEIPEAATATPAEGGATAPTSTAAPAAAEASDTGTQYSLNKIAGIVSVYANEKLHKKIKEYVDLVNKQVGGQVLIEAKLLEVALTDEFATGVEWSNINLANMPWDKKGIFNGLDAEVAFPQPSLDPSLGGGNVFSMSLNTSRIDGLVEAINRFGKVQALASPRLTVLNNQSAVLNVVRNQTYFEIKEEEEEDDNGNTTTTRTATPKTAPDGVMVNVTPSINFETGEITLTLRPTVSKIDDTTEDPTEPDNLVPNVSVQEFDSVLKIKSGEVAILGGLLRDKTSNAATGVPILNELPIMGPLFRSKSDKIEKTELIVLIRATVLDTASDGVHQTDKDMYKTFSNDRRPFPM
jgi:MSHA biogenesis protein MshL